MENERMKLVMYYASTKHEGMRHGPLPYTHHLQDVERVLRRFGVTEQAMLEAAWLHDTLEDTGTKLKEIRELFGPRVAELVHAVTDVKDSAGKPQKALTYPKILEVNGATMLKLADRIANVEYGGSKVDEYKKEYSQFRRSLYTEGDMCTEMWKHLDSLMK